MSNRYILLALIVFVSSFFSGLVVIDPVPAGTSEPPLTTSTDVPVSQPTGPADTHPSSTTIYSQDVSAVTPTIDGTLGSGEWSEPAFTMPIKYLWKDEEKTGNMEGYFINDEDSLYVAITLTTEDFRPDMFEKEKILLKLDLFFDERNDGVLRKGEDVKWFWELEYRDAHQEGNTYSVDKLKDGEGTCIYSSKANAFVYEFRIPLNSGDTEDLAVKAGDTLGIKVKLSVFQEVEVNKRWSPVWYDGWPDARSWTDGSTYGRLVLAAGSSLVSPIPPPPPPVPEPAPTGVYRFNAYAFTPPQIRLNKAMRYTMDLISERTDGRITFQFQEQGTLKPDDTYDAVCRREIDISLLPPYSCYEHAPSSRLFGIPGLIPDIHAMQAGLDEGVADLIRREWDAGEGTAIAFFPYSSCDIATNRNRVILPDDLKKQATRIRSVNDMSTFWLKLCGAEPLYLPSSEVHESLEIGAIDGQLMAASSFQLFEWSKVTDYYTRIQLVHALGIVFMNKEALGSLPPDLKGIFTEAWEKDYPDYYLKLMDEDHAEVKKVVQRDCEFYEATPAERRAWYDALSELVTAWLIAEMNADPKIINKSVAIYSKYQQSEGLSPVPPPITPPAPAQEASVSGTIWAGTNSLGNYMEYHFQTDGTLHYKSPSGFWKNASWKQDGNRIYMEMNDKYAEREGTITGNRMEGNAWNIRGLKWTWTAEKQ